MEKAIKIKMSKSEYERIKKENGIPIFDVGARVRTFDGHKCRVMQNNIKARFKTNPDIQVTYYKLYDLHDHETVYKQESEIQDEKMAQFYDSLRENAFNIGKCLEM